jgi:hypothetical protein
VNCWQDKWAAEPRCLKAVQHLREANLLTNSSMKDLALLTKKELEANLFKENRERDLRGLYEYLFPKDCPAR